MSDPELTTTYTITAFGTTQDGPLDIDISWDLFGGDDVEHIDWGQYMLDYDPEMYYDHIPPGSITKMGNNLIIDAQGLGRASAIIKSDLTGADGLYELEDAIIQSNLWIEAGENEGQVIFRYQDAGNYYFAGIGGEGYLGAIGMMSNGSYTLLAHSAGPNDGSEIELFKEYKLRIEDVDDEIKLYINDILSCTVVDSSVQGNLYGISAWNTKVRFMEFKIADKEFSTYHFFDQFGTSKKQNSMYITNQSEYPLNLSMGMQNMIPAALIDHVNLYFNGGNSALGVNRVRTSTVEFEVLPTATNVLPSDGTVSDFSFEIVLTVKKALDIDVLSLDAYSYHIEP